VATGLSATNLEDKMRKLAFVLGMVFLVTWLAIAPALAAGAPADSNKHTKLGLYVTAKEAFDMWSANKDKVKVLDVRTPEEYSFVGHAPMAANVPSLVWTGAFNAEKKDFVLKANDKFVEEIKAKFKSDDTILVMCRSGHRSAAAVQLLAAAGFTKAYNIVDGFEGDKEKDKASPNVGKRTVDGWRNSSVPWTYDMDAALVYSEKK
jgi:rhodanese-related sulfurtransferase